MGRTPYVTRNRNDLCTTRPMPGCWTDTAGEFASLLLRKAA